jgi:hypothetical protein
MRSIALRWQTFLGTERGVSRLHFTTRLAYHHKQICYGYGLDQQSLAVDFLDAELLRLYRHMVSAFCFVHENGIKELRRACLTLLLQ